MAIIFFDTSTQLAAGATFIGGTAGNGGQDGVGRGSGMIRDASVDDGSNRFGAQAGSDQAGTLYIDGSFTPTGPWRQAGSVAVSANVTADLDVPVRFRYYRTRYVNGATQTGAGNFSIHSSFRSGQ